ncbi:hypothetical protein ACLK1S_14030 [Escherichia coli]
MSIPVAGARHGTIYDAGVIAISSGAMAMRSCAAMAPASARFRPFGAM